MKLLLVGDTHCNQTALAQAINFASEQELDAIFQVGDFGFWPRHQNGRDFIQMADESPVPIYALPGNHEDWDEWETQLEGFRDPEDGFVVRSCTSSLHLSPKVHSWTWDGLRFGVLGGAYSVDCSMRTPGVDHFSQEVPQFEDLEGLPDKVDILLTHEAPINLAQLHHWNALPKMWKVDWELSNQSQKVIWEALDKTKPALLVHGHWHYRTTYRIPEHDTLIQGLDQASGTTGYDSWAILDTEVAGLYNLSQYLYGEGITWQLN